MWKVFSIQVFQTFILLKRRQKKYLLNFSSTYTYICTIISAWRIYVVHLPWSTRQQLIEKAHKNTFSAGIFCHCILVGGSSIAQRNAGYVNWLLSIKQGLFWHHAHGQPWRSQFASQIGVAPHWNVACSLHPVNVEVFMVTV